MIRFQSGSPRCRLDQWGTWSPSSRAAIFCEDWGNGPVVIGMENV